MLDGIVVSPHESRAVMILRLLLRLNGVANDWTGFGASIGTHGRRADRTMAVRSLSTRTVAAQPHQI
jgi:hypothetical protein